MELKGTIVAILPKEEGTSKAGKAWVRGGLVIEHEGGQYPKRCVMTTMKDALIGVIQGLSEGQEVECSINIDAREYNGKWYPDVQVWRINALSDTPAPSAPAQPQPQATAEATTEDDGLPF